MVRHQIGCHANKIIIQVAIFHFPTNSVTFNTNMKHNMVNMKRPSRAGATQPVLNEHETKQGTTLGRGRRLPCEAENLPVPRQLTNMQHATMN